MKTETFNALYADSKFQSKLKYFVKNLFKANKSAFDYLAYDEENLLQIAWMKIWELDDGQYKSFYFTCAKNKLLDELKKAKTRRKRLPEAEYYPVQGPDGVIMLNKEHLFYGGAADDLEGDDGW